MSLALLAIQNILQNSNIFIGSRETVLITPFGKKKVTQFSGLPHTSVSYLKTATDGAYKYHASSSCDNPCIASGQRAHGGVALLRLATDVPFIACVINLPCTFNHYLDMSSL